MKLPNPFAFIKKAIENSRKEIISGYNFSKGTLKNIERSRNAIINNAKAEIVDHIGTYYDDMAFKLDEYLSWFYSRERKLLNAKLSLSSLSSTSNDIDVMEVCNERIRNITDPDYVLFEKLKDTCLKANENMLSSFEKILSEGASDNDRAVDIALCASELYQNMAIREEEIAILDTIPIGEIDVRNITKFTNDDIKSSLYKLLSDDIVQRESEILKDIEIITSFVISDLDLNYDEKKDRENYKYNLETIINNNKADYLDKIAIFFGEKEGKRIPRKTKRLPN